MPKTNITQIAICKKKQPLPHIYQTGIPPWCIGRAQSELIKLAENEEIIGDVLDIGCGTGENAIYLAERGHMVWGIDLSEDAILVARKQAAAKNLNIPLIIGNALSLGVLGEGFHSVIDSGLFHIFSNTERKKYLQGLEAVTFKGSRLFVLCYSDKNTEQLSPRLYSKADLRDAFDKEHWKIHVIRQATYETLTHEKGIHAWLAIVIRK